MFKSILWDNDTTRFILPVLHAHILSACGGLGQYACWGNREKITTHKAGCQRRVTELFWRSFISLTYVKSHLFKKAKQKQLWHFLMPVITVPSFMNSYIVKSVLGVFSRQVLAINSILSSFTSLPLHISFSLCNISKHFIFIIL